MYIEVRFGQSSNILVPTLVMPLPIVARVRELHPLNAEAPMLVTPLGIVTLVNPLQS